MKEEVVISVKGVSKMFKLPHEKQSSIKGLVTSLGRRNKSYELQQALNNVSFDVKEGEFFGIVGRNGSGKSTLLKLLAGIYTPTQGNIDIKGRLTPFIELGVGFNPELTGRENVFLNGALLGFNRKEMSVMYSSIVEFAELEKFMDQKLKNYSSGMQVRLAFSIAIRSRSDILILDEVLAVGDEAFQQKCLEVFEKYKAQHKTVILVTHDMGIIKRFCDRAILINDGELVNSGSPDSIAAEYSLFNSDKMSERLSNYNHKIKSKIKLHLKDGNNKNCEQFITHDKLRLMMQWEYKNVKNAGVAIYKNSGEYVFGDNTLEESKKITGKSLQYELKLDVGPGRYHLAVGLFGESDKDVIYALSQGPEFVVTQKLGDEKEGIVRLESEWIYG